MHQRTVAPDVRGRARLRPIFMLALIGALMSLPAACRQGGAAPESAVDATMHRANPARTGVYQTEALAEYDSIKWQFEAGDWVFGAPAVAGDVVIFTSYDGNPYAADM